MSGQMAEVGLGGDSVDVPGSPIREVRIGASVADVEDPTLVVGEDQADRRMEDGRGMDRLDRGGLHMVADRPGVRRGGRH